MSSRREGNTLQPPDAERFQARRSGGTNSSTFERKLTPNVFQRNLEPGCKSGPPPSMTTSFELLYHIGQSSARASQAHTTSGAMGISSSLWARTAVRSGPYFSGQRINVLVCGRVRRNVDSARGNRTSSRRLAYASQSRRRKQSRTKIPHEV